MYGFFVKNQWNSIETIIKYFPVFIILFFSLNLITFILYFIKPLLVLKFTIKIDYLFIFDFIQYHLFLFEFSNNFALSNLNHFINYSYFYFIIGVDLFPLHDLKVLTEVVESNRFFL